MRFRTKSHVLEALTETKLLDLVDASLTNCERFTLEKAPGHSLSVSACDEGELILELHRGKKWEGWISAPIKMGETKAILTDYYHEPLSTSGGIEKRGEWLEVAVFHPAVYVVIFAAMAALLIWATFLRR